jgi:hypothetical protein
VQRHHTKEHHSDDLTSYTFAVVVNDVVVVAAVTLDVRNARSFVSFLD